MTQPPNPAPGTLRTAPPADSERREPPETEVVRIDIGCLEPDPFQPRTAFNEKTIRELADSIEQHGILQPLLVRPMQGPGGRGRYWIVAGERRYRASQLLGLKALPCRVRAYENMAAAVVALAENVHREDLSELDKAESLLRIKTLTDRTWDEVAELVRLSRDYVKRLAGLLKLEESVQELVRTGQISVRTAIALRPLPPRKQVEMARRVLSEGLTAEQVRQESRGQKRSARAGARRTAGYHAPVPEHLGECAEAVRQVEAFLSERDWSPSRVSPKQQAALEELHETVSLLHQHLLALRRPIREKQEPEAEKLRNARLPF